MNSILNPEDLINISEFRERDMFNPDNLIPQRPPYNIVPLVNARQFGYKPKTLSNYHLKESMETKTVMAKMEEINCDIPRTSRSTFLMTQSHDGSKIASAHGDHNIYICDVISGERLRTLSGHSRTPWTITFHPSCNNILGSGDLAGEVRVWDLQGRCAQWKTSHDNVVASLAFHPFLQLLVIAAGNALYFWDWTQPRPFAYCCTSTALERVRFVKFANEKLITGIANSPYERFLTKCKDRVKCKSMKERTESHGISQSCSHEEPTDDTVTSVIQRIHSDDDSSDSDSELDFCGMTSLLNKVLRIYDGVAVNCSKFETAFEKYLQENPDIEHLLGRAPTGACYMPCPLGNNRPPTTNLYEMIASVRNAINFYNVSRYPETLHERIIQTCHNLEELSYQIEILPDNGCDIPSDLMDYIGAFRRTRNTLIGIASHIFPHIHPHIYHPTPSDTYRSGFSNLITGSLRSRRSRSSDSLHRFQPRSFYPTQNMNGAPVNHNSTSSIDNSSQPSTSYLPEERNNLPGSSEVVHQRSETSREFQLPHTAGAIAARAVSPSNTNNWIITTHDHLFAIHPIQQRLSTHPDLSQCPSSSSFQRKSSSLNCSDNDTPQSSESMLHFSSDKKNRCSKRHQKQQQYISKKLCTDTQEIASNLHNPEPGCSSNTNSSHGLSNHFVTREVLESNVTGQILESNVTGQILESNVTEQILESNVTGQILESNVTDIREFVRPFNSSAIYNSTPQLDPVDTSNSGNRRSRNEFPSDAEGVHRNSAAAVRSDNNTSRRYDDAESIDILQRGIHGGPAAILSSGQNPVITEILDVARFPLVVDHRIQCWDFSTLTLPPIHDAGRNIVVNKCMIHNDASCDITKDGDKLITLIPPDTPRDNQTFRFGIFSILKENLGERLCVWGYVSGPVSLSFSPLGNYVIMGSAPPEHWIDDDRTVIIDVIKIFPDNGVLRARHVRGYTRRNSDQEHVADIRLNSVKWLSQMEKGFALGTNRGSLTICRPFASTIQFVGPNFDEPMAALERELPSEEPLDESSYAMIRSILLAGFSEDSTEE